jgi:hypothetical protein
MVARWVGEHGSWCEDARGEAACSNTSRHARLALLQHKDQAPGSGRARLVVQLMGCSKGWFTA